MLAGPVACPRLAQGGILEPYASVWNDWRRVLTTCGEPPIRLGYRPFPGAIPGPYCEHGESPRRPA
jgi:hypothetical protein